MVLKCINCGSETTEMRECDKCGKIGCHKCMKKTKNEWICLDCLKAKTQVDIQEQSNLFSIFK